MVAIISSQPTTGIVVVDTNILIIYAREGEPSRLLESQLGLQSGNVQAMVSAVTVGEALAFATKRNWGQKRRDDLMEMIRTKIVPIEINHPKIIEAYAEIDHYSEKVASPARPMGQNDMWIAATARALDCTLVTTDKDFDHLKGHLITRRWIDPTSLKPQKP